MADENNKESVGAILEKAPAGEKKKNLVWFSILGAIVVLASVAGFSVGRGLQGGGGGGEGAAVKEESPKKESKGEEGGHGSKEKSSEKAEFLSNDEYTYYKFETIAVSLNQPRADRYLKITINLAIKTGDANNAIDMLNKRKPELKSWLTVYLSNRTLDDVRGEKALNRLRREIQDALNQQLWGDGRPLIDQVLFDDFLLQ